MNEDLSPDAQNAPEPGEASSSPAQPENTPQDTQEPLSPSGETAAAPKAFGVPEAANSRVNDDVDASAAEEGEAALEGSPLPSESLAGEEVVARDEAPAANESGAPAEPHDSAAAEPEPEPEAEEEETAPVWVPEPDKLLCSLLFASHEYLNARALREIMGEEWDTPRLRQLVKKINRDLDAGGLAFEVVEVEGTFRIRTRPEYFPWTRKLFKDSTPRRLSQAALETLAIVAYKQPITKAEIESIRGVNVDGSLKTLLDKRLIDIGRRSDSLGQAFTYHTTREFLRYFGINRMPDDLPRLSEFEGILNAQSLIPQMGLDGEVHEVVRAEEPEQLSLGMGAERED